MEQLMNRAVRKDNKLIQARRHDAYRPTKGKPERSVCPQCGVCFDAGRWFWGTPPEHASETTCPACLRIADRFPAGFLEISGDFYVVHHDEVHNLINHVATSERDLHPLERIILRDETGDHLLVTTTGVHIARRIGEALSSAYKGELTFRYADDDTRIRISWHRS
jgi:hypothetical protein